MTTVSIAASGVESMHISAGSSEMSICIGSLYFQVAEKLISSRIRIARDGEVADITFDVKGESDIEERH